MGAGFGLKLHIFYSKSFKNTYGSGTKSKIDTLMGHSKTMMEWSSLDAKMVLSYSTEYLKKENYFNDLNYLSNKYLKKTKVDADLYVFLTYSIPGLAGVAW